MGLPDLHLHFDVRLPCQGHTPIGMVKLLNHVFKLAQSGCICDEN